METVGMALHLASPAAIVTMVERKRVDLKARAVVKAKQRRAQHPGWVGAEVGRDVADPDTSAERRGGRRTARRCHAACEQRCGSVGELAPQRRWKRQRERAEHERRRSHAI